VTKQHAYPPDYVSTRTLAYRLDCSPSTVESYVKRGLLPKPGHLGDLVRWKWKDVEGHVDAILRGTDSGPSARDQMLAGIANGAKADAESGAARKRAASDRSR